MSQRDRDGEQASQRDTVETKERIDEYSGRDTPKKRALRAIAAQAAVLSAAAHFLWAWPRLAESGDPRPYVFVLGGVFAVSVAAATLRAGEYRRLYALGAGTLLAFLVGYLGWHRADVLAAITADPLAIVAAAAEVIGVVAFVALYRLAPPTSVALERRREQQGRRADIESADADGDGGR